MKLSLHSFCSYYTSQQFISISYNWEPGFNPLECCSFLRLWRLSIVYGPWYQGICGLEKWNEYTLPCLEHSVTILILECRLPRNIQLVLIRRSFSNWGHPWCIALSLDFSSLDSFVPALEFLYPPLLADLFSMWISGISIFSYHLGIYVFEAMHWCVNVQPKLLRLFD